MKNAYTIIAVLALAPFLFACSGAKKKLGLEAAPPDEFSVIKRAPLDMPPNYYMRPPVPGQQRPQELPSIDAAKITAFGEPTKTAQPPITSGEQALLRSAGAENASDAIRAQVAVETETLREEKRSTFDKTFGTNFNGTPELSEAIDPIEESKRLKAEKKTAEESKPQTKVEPITDNAK